MALIEVNWNPDARQLRQFAVISVIGFGIAGLVWAWSSDAWSRSGWHAGWTGPASLWGLAGLIGLVGAVQPRMLKPLYVAWMGLTYPIGWLVSHVLLAVIFYGLFTIVAMVFRLLKHDPLQRRLDRGARSYWQEHRSPQDARRYLRQF